MPPSPQAIDAWKSLTWLNGLLSVNVATTTFASAVPCFPAASISPSAVTNPPGVLVGAAGGEAGGSDPCGVGGLWPVGWPASGGTVGAAGSGGGLTGPGGDAGGEAGKAREWTPPDEFAAVPDGVGATPGMDDPPPVDAPSPFDALLAGARSPVDELPASEDDPPGEPAPDVAVPDNAPDPLVALSVATAADEAGASVEPGALSPGITGGRVDGESESDVSVTAGALTSADVIDVPPTSDAGAWAVTNAGTAPNGISHAVGCHSEPPASRVSHGSTPRTARVPGVTHDRRRLAQNRNWP
ncbi:hypothetical protein [Fimbriiglobus ruber]|uniref:hypothetical protein n=1 Tax=Fimbriiglobus ruber TaxID=1908690 RepID=UPI000B4BD1F9|nr:hypothetical protein [Fimbriiglobus ruber]